MSAHDQLHDILIHRDVDAFVAGDWDSTAADFDAEAFTGYSGGDGTLRLTYPTLAAYRDSWLEQATEFAGSPPEHLRSQLLSAQRISRIEITDDKALCMKVFDGTVAGPDLQPHHLTWTTYYFLRHDASTQRWLITGFVGYLPHQKGLA